MTHRANGTFDVKLGPLEPYNKNEGAVAGRISLDKQFRGDLDATSKGEMLTAGTAVNGSAGYVAIERVTGNLKGRRGSFALQDSGTMQENTCTSLAARAYSGSDVSAPSREAFSLATAAT